MTHHYISPTHTHEKLESPSYSDLIDVFESRMRNWLIEPAKQLLKLEHGDVPAVSLLLGYFEGIEIYLSGQDSKGASKEFFRRGFKRIYRPAPENEHLYDHVIDALYDQARCGVAHDGLFRNRVFFSDGRPEALNVTLPRKDGEFVPNGNVESIVINATRFVEGVAKHLDQYVAALRSGQDQTLKENFLATVALKWGLDEPHRVIGMTEDEFFGRA